MKINIVNKNGFYLGDHLEGSLPKNWTADLVGDGYYKAQYQGANVNDETGEWTDGRWVEMGGPSPEDIEILKESLIASANLEKASLMSHASDMIGAIADEIEGLEDSEEDVPVKLRSDLKAWKQYRVVVKNVDVSLAPDIEWPNQPE
ncbi:TPA: tail fiber assembly protein [Yersinia enterocolitica]|uniref:tail fiber assembly protein n=1 Tax=Yersinia enterocolitica TaxID=630 RepID=UPI0005E50C7C|nr:tail fiber assembly protein [Yersinia enterocolitica]EKN4083689.1 tail fiber assembly protein [Yersinia enterocolitica]CFB70233.1 putative phage tail fiber assembly protein [Yersinia enterocolitica]HDU2631772.1 tail fiber assembly protein [Yersinia enterocolitica]HEA9922658.1 tail fiber assembly protein [Yersinia enterocolitica]HEN3437977.1 tail fiber assembly protein [Yersinia enterocolitica]